MPYIEQQQVFNQWKQMLGTSGVMANLPFPFLESLVCPSDLTTQTVNAPISYVVNCGQADLTPLQSINGSTTAQPTSTTSLGQPDYPANGIFLSRWDYYYSSLYPANNNVNYLTKLPRNTDDTIRDGKSNTLLLSENLEARNWYDELSLGDPNTGDANSQLTSSSTTNTMFSLTNTTNGYFGAPVGGAMLTSSVPASPALLTPEAYAGFVWWPYAAPPTLVANINGLPQTEVGYATDMFYARPSSNHPGIVVASYADGRVTTMSENINYLVYCLLMTPDGAKCNPAGLPFMTSTDPNLPAVYTNGHALTGGFRNSTISGLDTN